MKDTETKSNFVMLRAKGLSYDKIANELNVSKQTLIDWSQKLELEISNLKQIEDEAIVEQYCFSKVKRLELLKVLFERLETELKNRDLSELQTEKLFQIYLKCLDDLTAGRGKLRFSKKGALELDLDVLQVWLA